MSLFTFNFKSEAKVLAIVAAVLLLTEAGVRITLPRMSSDWHNFAAISSVVNRVQETPDITVMFLGNSLTGRSIEPAAVRNRVHDVATGTDVRVEKIATDDSNVAEWYYLVRRIVAGERKKPQLLVIGYAEDQLSDRAPIHVDRLGGYYGGLGIAREAFANDITDFGSRADFVLSSFSGLYANRDRVRTQVLDRLIPNYRAYAQRSNRTAKALVAVERTTPQYRRLERLLAVCRQYSVAVALVAMPIPYHYEVDTQVEKLTRTYGAAFFDMTNVSGLTQDRFTDGYHLDAVGAQIYSSEFGRALAASGLLVKNRQALQSRSVAPF